MGWSAWRVWIGLWVAALTACAPEEGARRTAESALAVQVVDDAGREVALEAPARRVVSLVPSVTETILAIGGGDRLVARTRYDREPELAELPSLGGGLDPSVERLVGLRPDLVVAWNARDDRVLEPRLRQAGIRTYAASIQDTTGIFTTLERMGRLLALEEAADSVAGALRDTIRAVTADARAGPRPEVLYLIAGDPPRTAGPGTFIGQAIGIAGGVPAFSELAEEWPAVSLEAVLARDPDVLIVPVGPGLPGGAEIGARAGWRDLSAVQQGRILEIDADLLARPGPWLGRAARALQIGLDQIALPARTPP